MNPGNDPMTAIEQAIDRLEAEVERLTERVRELIAMVEARLG